MGRTDTSIVDALEKDAQPAWLWDVGRRRMAWANQAAVTFWQESSPFDLIDRLFSPAEIAAIEFGQTFDALPADQHENISVVLFPTAGGQRVEATCRRHPLPDGRSGLLVHVLDAESEDDSHTLERIRSALENMPGVVSVFGTDGKVLLESELAKETFGPYSSLPDRLGSERARDFYADLFDRGLAHKTCDVFTDLGKRQHRVSGKRITDPVSGFAAAITLFTDVTDRLALESRKHDPADLPDQVIQDRIEAALAAFPVGVLLLGPQGHIQFANASACAMLGTTKSGLIGSPFARFLSRSDTETSLAEQSRRLLSGADLRLKRPDGEKQIAHVTVAPLSEIVAAPMFLAVLEDVTSHHETLRLLMNELDTAKLESAQKSQFLANVGHELRTPLNAIIGFSEIMKDQRLGPLDNERYRQYAKDIHHSGHLLLSLINDLLDLSKVQAGKLKLQFADINLRTIVEQSVRLVQPQAQKKKVKLRLVVPPVLPLVKADARSLEQVVLNLLTNAIKFTEESGEVAISIATAQDGTLDLRVEDTGIGMSADELDRAMKPFEQIDSTVAKPEKGTGLGLPLAKALTEANHAQFTIHSVPRQGTSVALSFPATKASA